MMHSDRQLSETRDGWLVSSGIDEFEIIDDDIDPPDSDDRNLPRRSPWRILIVDDEEDVHAATQFALENIRVLDRPVELLHAYSASSAFEMIQNESDLALMLLDVVMEQPDAGLKLVKRLRQEGFLELRIVLRTGQPGYAPEMTVMSDYDINDYRTKSELTQARLISLVTTSCRSYQQLHIINENRRGLELIVKSTEDLYKRKNLYLFANGVLKQLISFLGTRSTGLVAVSTTQKSYEDEFNLMQVVASTETNDIDPLLQTGNNNKIRDAFFNAKQSPKGICINQFLALYFSSINGHNLFVFVDDCSDSNASSIALLKVFAANIAVGFENLALIERLDELAYFDPIFQLPNENALELEFERFKNKKEPMALVAVHINELGHSISVFGTKIVYEAMRQVSYRLMSELKPPPCYLCSDGKSDFIIVTYRHTVNIKAIEGIFNLRFEVDGVELSFSASIAVVNIDDSMNMETSIRHIISALTLAKQQPANPIVYFDSSMSQALEKRIKLQSSLRQALDKHQAIEAYLQPKVNLLTGRIVGAEALCRWQLNGQFISPVEFIPIAEAGGLSWKLTRLMIQQVGRFIQQALTDGLPIIPIAVNLSMQDLQLQEFTGQLFDQLEALNLNPEVIEFEITESVMISNPRKIIEKLNQLKNKGYKIAIDDFGTGYSSLSYLQQLPVTSLKVDKSFVDDLILDTARHSLAAASISIAESMGLSVIAEGVETRQQLDALKALGCDICQGYLFSKPISMAAFRSSCIERGKLKFEI